MTLKTEVIAALVITATSFALGRYSATSTAAPARGLRQ